MLYFAIKTFLLLKHQISRQLYLLTYSTIFKIVFSHKFYQTLKLSFSPPILDYEPFNQKKLALSLNNWKIVLRSIFFYLRTQHVQFRDSRIPFEKCLMIYIYSKTKLSMISFCPVEFENSWCINQKFAFGITLL